MKRSINPEDLCYSIGSLRIVVESLPRSTTYYVGELSKEPVDVIDVLAMLECLEEDGATIPFRVIGEKPFDSSVADMLFPIVRALILAADLN